MKWISIIAMLLAPLMAAYAEDEAAPCSSEGYHHFDFWIGEWDVHTADGKLAGTNSIQREENGCLLLERWTNSAGGTGQSYNFYNPQTDKWRQVWIDQTSIIDYEGGLDEAGSMILEGQITYQSSGQSFLFTGQWTLQEDGRVRQHFEQLNPETDMWEVWFTGFYSRRSP